MDSTGKRRFLKLHELEKFRDEAYMRPLGYKEKMKRLHDSKLRGNNEFNTGDKGLFNSRLRFIPVDQAFPYGTVELNSGDGKTFKVNGHHLKHYIEGPGEERLVEQLDLPLVGTLE
ncbi:uncharacterized protein LOC110925425 [Helianthus annuus]|uniref:uncharacterized protein LOC110925425 n=1 Tax=Helianthus annuus TaxID=4232 RepID=UPI000B9043C4|nr:uncharacterized protein LOC110925425 [Helianthus annuus]